MAPTAEEKQPISRPPTTLELVINRFCCGLATGFAWLAVILVLGIVIRLTFLAFPAIQNFGFSFILTSTWDSATNEYGILPEIWGTLYSSLLALCIGSVFGVSVAIFLNEGFLGGFVYWIFKLGKVGAPSFLGKDTRQDGIYTENHRRFISCHSQCSVWIVGDGRRG